VADEKTVKVPPLAVKAAAKFVADHGKHSKAVVERVGRAGARIVLIGTDGAMGDVVVPDLAVGEAVVAEVADLELSEWDRETTSLVRIGPAHRRKMAGPRARR
jgi:hypothetical protein